MELTSKQIQVIGHFKEGELVAFTITNGISHLYKVEEMNAQETEQFYEVDKI